MVRPELPPESFSRYTPTFQFPKTLIQPLIRPLVKLQDAGKLSAVPLCQHIVICGFPRSGTTLFQLMIESCVAGIKTFGRERRALEFAKYGRRTHASVMTKRPKDIFLIQELRDFYASHPADVQFIVMHRDPRAVLTSVHFSRPSEYFVSTNQWQHIYRHWKWASNADDVLSIRYEDVVCGPDFVESQFAQITGCQLSRPFRDFHKNIPAGFDGRALNGLRELDESNVLRWREACHRDRIRSLLQELPELPDVLIEMGYETDDSWTREYVDSHQPISAAA
jgi:5-methylcytosine-specific restriction endonuclease McrA